MALNQIIPLAFCLITFIILCVVVYLKVYPVKWYQYIIHCRTDCHDWPDWDTISTIWLCFKIEDEFSIAKTRNVIRMQTGKVPDIKDYKLIRTKRCKRGEKP